MVESAESKPVEPKWVLLVDDEPAVTTGLARALRDEPYSFITASSGAEALEILARQRIDIIVSDDMMPGMRGTELLARVRYEYPEVIRIILTGHASVKSAMQAIHDGWIYQYLHKPCHPADLAAVLYTALLLKSLAPPAGGAGQCTEVGYRRRLLESVTGPNDPSLKTDEPFVLE